MPANKMIYQEKMIETLKKNDFKITKPRRQVIEALLEMNGHHCTVEELYDAVSKKNPKIGVATVYRTINMLYDLRLVAKLDLLDGYDRYEIITNEHHHHHLVCDHCGKTIEVMIDYLDPLEELIAKEYGFIIEGHVLKFNGICQDCRKRMENNEEESQDK